MLESIKIPIDEFIKTKKDECIKMTGYDPTKYLYEDYGGFPEIVDVYFYQLPDLINELKSIIESHYSDEWRYKVRNKVTPYDWNKWDYKIATEFKFDWSEYQWKSLTGWNHLPLAYSSFDICIEYEGHEFYFKVFKDSTHIDWLPSEEYQLLPNIDVSTDSIFSQVNIKTQKSLRRWIKKQKFPKGTVIKVDTGYIGGEFKINCR